MVGDGGRDGRDFSRRHGHQRGECLHAPQMGNFGQTLSAITWVATSYSIAEMLMITMAGWWSTLLGRKRLYLASLVLFTLWSMLAGTAQTFPQMLCYRILQGLGGGSLIPISQAILRETYPPEEQGMAMAIFGMGVVLAPAMGPILGGWLTDNYGWPWVFYIELVASFLKCQHGTRAPSLRANPGTTGARAEKRGADWGSKDDAMHMIPPCFVRVPSREVRHLDRHFPLSFQYVVPIGETCNQLYGKGQTSRSESSRHHPERPQSRQEVAGFFVRHG